MTSELSLQTFNRAAKELPAYRSFLKKHNLDPKNIKTVADFKQVPITSKKNYLLPNNAQDLVWDEDNKGLLLYCATSGSTGDPYYFPRSEQLSEQYSYILENYLNYSSYGKGRTLVIIGFGMGVWIGGVITQRAFEVAAQRAGVPLSILPTSYNKTEIFKALRKLAPKFEQTIIVGYPPFIKELVDDAPGEKIDMRNLNIRLLFAAEAFNETFRDYVCNQGGVASPLRDTLNIYGSADAGAMAYETPLSILVRRLAINNPLLYADIFGQIEKTPTLAQYNNNFIEFEEVNGELLLTADTAMPLIRYAIGDHGGVLSYVHISKIMKRYGIAIDNEIKELGIDGFVDKNQPFVFVYERSDLSTTLHGFNVYPEFIKESLLRRIGEKNT